jgi:hypothetical protein
VHAPRKSSGNQLARGCLFIPSDPSSDNGGWGSTGSATKNATTSVATTRARLEGGLNHSAPLWWTMQFITMIHHDEDESMNRDDHHDDHHPTGWTIMMHHNDSSCHGSSWWIIMYSSWWITMMGHHDLSWFALLGLPPIR